MCKRVVILCVLPFVAVVSSVIVQKHDKLWTKSYSPSFKYSVDDLLRTVFPKKTSDDIYLDPCKAGNLI